MQGPLGRVLRTRGVQGQSGAEADGSTMVTPPLCPLPKARDIAVQTERPNAEGVAVQTEPIVPALVPTEPAPTELGARNSSAEQSPNLQPRHVSFGLRRPSIGETLANFRFGERRQSVDGVGPTSLDDPPKLLSPSNLTRRKSSLNGSSSASSPHSTSFRRRQSFYAGSINGNVVAHFTLNSAGVCNLLPNIEVVDVTEPTQLQAQQMSVIKGSIYYHDGDSIVSLELGGDDVVLFMEPDVTTFNILSEPEGKISTNAELRALLVAITPPYQLTAMKRMQMLHQAVNIICTHTPMTMIAVAEFQFANSVMLACDENAQGAAAKELRLYWTDDKMVKQFIVFSELASITYEEALTLTENDHAAEELSSLLKKDFSKETCINAFMAIRKLFSLIEVPNSEPNTKSEVAVRPRGKKVQETSIYIPPMNPNDALAQRLQNAFITNHVVCVGCELCTNYEELTAAVGLSDTFGAATVPERTHEAGLELRYFPFVVVSPPAAHESAKFSTEDFGEVLVESDHIPADDGSRPAPAKPTPLATLVRSRGDELYSKLQLSGFDDPREMGKMLTQITALEPPYADAEISAIVTNLNLIYLAGCINHKDHTATVQLLGSVLFGKLIAWVTSIKDKDKQQIAYTSMIKSFNSWYTVSYQTVLDLADAFGQLKAFAPFIMSDQNVPAFCYSVVGYTFAVDEIFELCYTFGSVHIKTKSVEETSKLYQSLHKKISNIGGAVNFTSSEDRAFQVIKIIFSNYIKLTPPNNVLDSQLPYLPVATLTRALFILQQKYLSLNTANSDVATAETITLDYKALQPQTRLQLEFMMALVKFIPVVRVVMLNSIRALAQCQPGGFESPDVMLKEEDVLNVTHLKIIAAQAISIIQEQLGENGDIFAVYLCAKDNQDFLLNSLIQFLGHMYYQLFRNDTTTTGEHLEKLNNHIAPMLLVAKLAGKPPNESLEIRSTDAEVGNRALATINYWRQPGHAVATLGRADSDSELFLLSRIVPVHMLLKAILSNLATSHDLLEQPVVGMTSPHTLERLKHKLCLEFVANLIRINIRFADFFGQVMSVWQERGKSFFAINCEQLFEKVGTIEGDVKIARIAYAAKFLSQNKTSLERVTDQTTLAEFLNNQPKAVNGFEFKLIPEFTTRFLSAIQIQGGAVANLYEFLNQKLQTLGEILGADSLSAIFAVVLSGIGSDGDNAELSKMLCDYISGNPDIYSNIIIPTLEWLFTAIATSTTNSERLYYFRQLVPAKIIPTDQLSRLVVDGEAPGTISQRLFSMLYVDCIRATSAEKGFAMGSQNAATQFETDVHRSRGVTFNGDSYPDAVMQFCTTTPDRMSSSLNITTEVSTEDTVKILLVQQDYRNEFIYVSSGVLQQIGFKLNFNGITSAQYNVVKQDDKEIVVGFKCICVDKNNKDSQLQITGTLTFDVERLYSMQKAKFKSNDLCYSALEISKIVIVNPMDLAEVNSGSERPYINCTNIFVFPQGELRLTAESLK